jgi:hypothetical protein
MAEHAVLKKVFLSLIKFAGMEFLKSGLAVTLQLKICIIFIVLYFYNDGALGDLLYELGQTLPALSYVPFPVTGKIHYSFTIIFLNAVNIPLLFFQSFVI